MLALAGQTTLDFRNGKGETARIVGSIAKGAKPLKTSVLNRYPHLDGGSDGGEVD